MKLFSLALLFLLTIIPSTGMAEDAEQQQNGLIQLDFSAASTQIEAEKLVLFAGKRTFTYTGDVRVVHGDMVLTCKKLDGMYTENNEIKSLIATQDVYIEKGESIKASSNKAVFNNEAQTLRLTENPKLEQDGSVLAADEVIIYLKEDRSEALGRVQVTVLDQTGGKPGAAGLSPGSPAGKKKGKKKGKNK